MTPLFRIFPVLALLVLPVPPVAALEMAEARHLLARTGFGQPRVEELRAIADLAYPDAVDRLIADVRTEAVQPLPPWADEPPPDRAELMRMEAGRDEIRTMIRETVRERRMALKAWWYREMLLTSSPLTEKMVLFWHNHFTSSLKKARWPQFMLRQNALFRQHALGNFGDLLHAVAFDAAMILYLDGQSNKAASPNENFARELVELFTLGEGHYDERDVKEIARAFTGWSVNRRTGQVVFDRAEFDSGDKVIFGETCRCNAHEALDRILKQEQVAVFIVEKLWRAFVSPAPDGSEVRRLAGVFRASDYELKPLLRAMLLSDAFRDPGNRGTLVKSPVDLVIGTLRLNDQAGRRMLDRHLIGIHKALGQDLLDPPNVKGWPGHESWITSATVLTREQFLTRLLRARGMDSLKPAGDRTALVSPEWLIAFLMPVPPVDDLPEDSAAMLEQEPLELIAALILDPAFQVK